MAIGRPRFDLTLSRRSLVSALGLIGIVGAIVGLCALLIGPNTAQAAYLTIMLLLSPLRSARARSRYAAATVAVVVAIGGFLLGPLGIGPVLAGIVVVSLVQGLFRFGEIATMTRSPANLLAFAGLAATGAELWQMVLGSLIGAAFALLVAHLLPPDQRSDADAPPLRERVIDGVVLATGAVTLVGLAEWAQFPFAGWALLSLCMILTVGVDDRVTRSLHRVAGTVVGAVVGTLVSFAPGPWPLVVAVVATVLCVAYLREGNYTMFIALLTPVVLLTSTTDLDPVQAGLGRIEAVLAAAIVAVVLSVLLDRVRRR